MFTTRYASLVPRQDGGYRAHWVAEGQESEPFDFDFALKEAPRNGRSMEALHGGAD